MICKLAIRWQKKQTPMSVTASVKKKSASHVRKPSLNRSRLINPHRLLSVAKPAARVTSKLPKDFCRVCLDFSAKNQQQKPRQQQAQKPKIVNVASAAVAVVIVPVVDADVIRRMNVQSHAKAKNYVSLRLKKSKSHVSPSHRVSLKRHANLRTVMSHAANAVIVSSVMTSVRSQSMKIPILSAQTALTQQTRIQ